MTHDQGASPPEGRQDVVEPATAYQRAEERLCSCGAAGSGESHLAWCEWQSSEWRKWGDAFNQVGEGRQDGGYAAIRKIVFDALDLSAGIRDDCTADVMNALTKAGALTHSVEAPTHWAVYSKSGVHIGLWENEAIAKDILREYQGGTIVALAAQPLPKQGTEEDA